MGLRIAPIVLFGLLAGCQADQRVGPVATEQAHVTATVAPAVPCKDGYEVVDQLLKAIVDGDEASLRRVVNNDATLDPESVSWLIGGPDVHPGGRAGLSSARTVLLDQRVLTKVVATGQADGSTIIEAIFLPGRTAEDFGSLLELSNSGSALNFRDFVMCEFVVQNGRTFMRNTCFLDTDVFGE